MFPSPALTYQLHLLFPAQVHLGHSRSTSSRLASCSPDFSPTPRHLIVHNTAHAAEVKSNPRNLDISGRAFPSHRDRTSPPSCNRTSPKTLHLPRSTSWRTGRNSISDSFLGDQLDHAVVHTLSRGTKRTVSSCRLGLSQTSSGLSRLWFYITPGSPVPRYLRS